LEATKENAKLIAKLATNDARLRKDLDSVLTLLSNYKQDTDGDGVSDIMDKCPQTAQKVRGLVDKHGCPLDSDGDGVPDYEDKCPKTYGDIANNGCPEIKKEVKELFRQALQGIQFETAKADILPASSVILDKIADILLLNPSYLIEIQGHTDNFGNSSSNLILSESRAEAVRKYLVEKGVNNSRLSSHGYGDTKPVANNNTSEGRSKNRRVEFIVSFEK
jgi:outer membrane protein OmpA-like peptidoglycan-associated protein